MKTIVLKLMLFSVIWCEHLILSGSKVDLESIHSVDATNDPNKKPVPRAKFGFEDVLQDSRLKKYLTSYFSKRFHFPEQWWPVENTTIVRNEFITNQNGEYTLNYQLDSGLFRAETGTFEEVDNGTRFVVRGLFSYSSSLWVYKSSSDEFFMKDYTLEYNINPVEHIVKSFLCSCCTRHNVCSKMCDNTIAEHELCPPSANPKTQLPKIKKQSFKVYRNNSYELKISFKNDTYKRAEFLDFFENTSILYDFGYFPDPDKSGAYLQYFYQTDYYGFYFKNKGFPDLSPHKCPPGTLGQYPNCFTLTTIRPQTGDVDIEGHVLKTLIG